MPSSRFARRPPLNTRKLVLLALLACALVGGGAAALTGAEALGEWAARWSSASDGTVAPGGNLLSKDETAEMSRLVGRWVDKEGKRLILTARGEVWSDKGDMEGWALSDLPAGADFGFGDGRFACSYAIAFKSENAAEWRLVQATSGTTCPSGPLERRFSFSG